MEKSFEDALKELEAIVGELESGNTELDQAISKYTEAMKLAKHCSEKLDNATKSVNKILNDNKELVDFQIEDNEKEVENE